MQYGRPVRVVDLGVTHLPREVFEDYLHDILVDLHRCITSHPTTLDPSARSSDLHDPNVTKVTESRVFPC
jgi:hypothetical protein